MRKLMAFNSVGIIACLLFLLAVCIDVTAEEERKRGPHIEGGESGIEFMNKFDLNKDGKIDHEEWEAVKPSTVYRLKHWPEYNVDGDDSITLEEVPEKDGKSEPAPPEGEKKGVTALQAAFIVKFDKDQDGKLSKTEFTGNYFSVYDRNGDGYIEAEEAPSGKTAY
jgi:Ca2+-binding EF-hand superfamily protein